MKNKKIIVIGLIIVEIISCFLMYKSSQNKITKLDDVKLKENNKNSMFAIMVKNSKGEYEEYTKGNTFPTTNDGYIFSKASCMDNTGKEIEGIVTTNGDSITITGTTTAYCVIYFDLCNIPDKGFNSTNQITACPVGGMYRYQGTDNVNNWICFGADEEICNTPSTASNYEEIVDKYMYRIIGVTPEGQLKLIKETFVREETTATSESGVVKGSDDKYYQTKFQWHNKATTTDCGTDGSKCTWEKSRIFNRLNGYCGKSSDLSERNNTCTGTTTGWGGDSNIFIGNSYYEYLQDNTWLNKIANNEWKYGDNDNYSSYNGDTIYAIENGFTDTITTKIGLQYQYDYLYAYPGGNPGTVSNAFTSWIQFQKDGYNDIGAMEGIQARYIIGTYLVSLYLGSTGYVSFSNASSTQFSVRPVFYLNSDVEILGGTGEKTSPYYLEEKPNLVNLCDEYNDLGTCMENEEGNIGSIANLTQDTPGGIHRYQGTDNVNNWICFGTTENCSKTDDLIDKYMYRIIGVASDGKLKLIKETFVRELQDDNNYVYYFRIHSENSLTSCYGDSCAWKNVDIYKRLNGISSGTLKGSQGDTNLFINSKYYDYLNSSNTNNWLNYIYEYSWKYGDLTLENINGNYNILYDGNSLYQIENNWNANTSTADHPAGEISARIGLIYIHDYAYSYPGGNPSNNDNAKKSWIHFRKDGYNISRIYDYDGFITRYGYYNLSNMFHFWYIDINGALPFGDSLTYPLSFRPVFYLNDTIKILYGDGSKTNPYIIKQ